MNTYTAVYIRVSTKDQKLASQEVELDRCCKVRGWKNVERYTDRMSGAKTSRPELDRMLTDLRAGKVERVVVYKLDRLGRSLTHMAMIIEEMTRLKVPLICTSQGIDTSGDSPVGKLQLGVLMAVAEFERDIIRERTVAGLEAARERGVTLGRPPTLKRRKAEVTKLKAAGVGIREIGRRLKMPPSSVHAVIKAA
jgi:putative DNA-invertase from lambdoid prophage Rac